MNHDSDQPTPDEEANRPPGQPSDQTPHDQAQASPVDGGAQPAPNEPPDNAWFDGGTSEPRAPARPRSTRSWIVGGVTAVAIAAAATFGISAVSSHSASSSAQTLQAGGGFGRGGLGTQGTITAIAGNTITVKTASGTTKVTTGTSTEVSVAKSGTVADIVTGDHVMVTGTTSGTKITATRIVDQGKTATATGPGAAGGLRPSGGTPPSGGFGPRAGGTGRPTNGTVTNVSGSTLTVKGTDGTTYTVSTGSSTTVTVESTGALSDLAAGDTVQVIGQTGTSGAVAATRIVDGAAADLAFGGTPPSA